MSDVHVLEWLASVATGACVVMVAALLAPRTRVRRIPVRPSDSAAMHPVASRMRAVIDVIHSASRRHRQRLDPAALGSWIDDLSTAVRRGVTLRQSLLDVLPADPHLETHTAALRHALHRGAGVPEASRRWVDTIAGVSSPERRHLIAAASVLGVAAEVGGSVSQPLDRLAAAMRLSAADDLERAAQSAQARISARVLTVLPLAVLAFLFTADRDVRSTIGSTAGLVIVSLGLALNLTGGWWMSRIIDRSTR